MSEQTNLPAIKSFFMQDNVKTKFTELLGKRSTSFITGVMSVVSNNTLLAKASGNSIYQAAMLSAILDLPINNNLGWAWIVPYGSAAQFQVGYKGFIQLALRSGQYADLGVVEVYQSQFVAWDSIKSKLTYNKDVRGTGGVIGYFAYLELENGFYKEEFWYSDEVESHGRKYSKSFNSGPWKSEFDKMAKKTVLKSLISHWGPLSIEMQSAMAADQSVVKDAEKSEFEWVDVNQAEEQEQQSANPELDRALSLLGPIVTKQQVDSLAMQVNHKAWPKNDQDQWMMAISAKLKSLANG